MGAEVRDGNLFPDDVTNQNSYFAHGTKLSVTLMTADSPAFSFALPDLKVKSFTILLFISTVLMVMGSVPEFLAVMSM